MTEAKWNIFPIQSLRSIIWHKSNNTQFIVSKSIDQRFGIKPGKKLHFFKVETCINKFVEEEVPLFVEQIYKFCKKSVAAGSPQSPTYNEDSISHSDISKIIKKMKKKLLKLERLRNVIHNDDLDDFDLRISPAKLKINSSVEYFLEITCIDVDLNSQIGEAVPFKNRSHKAKDLLSFLSDNDDGYKNKIKEQSDEEYEVYGSTSQIQNEINALQHNEDSLRNVEHLHQDIVDLHKLMEELHCMVCNEKEVIDSISDHIEQAGESIQEGNKKLKKVTILKAAAFPVTGAVVGGIVGGPIGLFAGMKVGSMISGMAMAGVAGSLVGYQGGKYLKRSVRE